MATEAPELELPQHPEIPAARRVFGAPRQVWVALRSIVVTRHCPDFLDSMPPAEKRLCLAFMLERAQQSESEGSLVRECLAILLERQPWLAAACAAGSTLRRGLLEEMAGQGPLLAPLAQAEASAEPGSEEPETSEEPEVSERDSEAAGAPRQTALEKLVEAREVLKALGWHFPRDRLGTRGDEAVRALNLLHDGLAILETRSGREAVKENVAGNVQVCLEPHWAPLLDFLLTMHDSGVRRSYCARLRFVVLRLREHLPAFRQLRPWAELPWGSEAPPAWEEAVAALSSARSRAEDLAQPEEAAQLPQEPEAEVETMQVETMQAEVAAVSPAEEAVPVPPVPPPAAQPRRSLAGAPPVPVSLAQKAKEVAPVLAKRPSSSGGQAPRSTPRSGSFTPRGSSFIAALTPRLARRAGGC